MDIRKIYLSFLGREPPIWGVELEMPVWVTFVNVTNRAHSYGKTWPDSKIHGANMGPIWGRQDPGGPHVGPMNFVDVVFVSWRRQLFSYFTIHS